MDKTMTHVTVSTEKRVGEQDELVKTCSSPKSDLAMAYCVIWNVIYLPHDETGIMLPIKEGCKSLKTYRCA